MLDTLCLYEPNISRCFECSHFYGFHEWPNSEDHGIEPPAGGRNSRGVRGNPWGSDWFLFRPRQRASLFRPSNTLAFAPALTTALRKVDFEHVFSCDTCPQVKKQILANFSGVKFFVPWSKWRERITTGSFFCGSSKASKVIRRCVDGRIRSIGLMHFFAVLFHHIDYRN